MHKADWSKELWSHLITHIIFYTWLSVTIVCFQNWKPLSSADDQSPLQSSLKLAPEGQDPAARTMPGTEPTLSENLLN